MERRVLGVSEFSARFGNRASKIARGFDPFGNYCFGTRNRVGVGLSIGYAAGQLRDLDDETLVLPAPENNQLVTRYYSLDTITFAR